MLLQNSWHTVSNRGSHVRVALAMSTQLGLLYAVLVICTHILLTFRAPPVSGPILQQLCMFVQNLMRVKGKSKPSEHVQQYSSPHPPEIKIFQTWIQFGDATWGFAICTIGSQKASNKELQLNFQAAHN